MAQVRHAWEYSHELLEKMVPFRERAQKTPFYLSVEEGARDLAHTKGLWRGIHEEARMTQLPLVYMVQDKANLGYDMSAAEQILAEGFYELDRNNDIALCRLTCRLMQAIEDAPKDPRHPHWGYTEYTSFEQHRAAVHFPAPKPAVFTRGELYDRIYAGWMAQICAGAVGTAVEGYSAENLEKAFGTIDGYLKMPEMYNDDLTFELVFLEEFAKTGNDVRPADIAEMWAARIPNAYTAEDVAIRNIKAGIYPPKSGSYRNPYQEYIGAQMRGGVCGMVAPGNPELAARLAWTDACVSHAGNGILGETFNAVLVSLGFFDKDLRRVCRAAIDLMPPDSEYRAAVEFAWNACEKHRERRAAWHDCEEHFRTYGWVHAYPNAAAEVVGLYFCGNNFDRLITYTAMCGLDVDCNCAQAANVPAVYGGMALIAPRWYEPFGDRMETYLRGRETVRYQDLANDTVDAMLRAGNAVLRCEE